MRTLDSSAFDAFRSTVWEVADERSGLSESVAAIREHAYLIERVSSPISRKLYVFGQERWTPIVGQLAIFAP